MERRVESPALEPPLRDARSPRDGRRAPAGPSVLQKGDAHTTGYYVSYVQIGRLVDVVYIRSTLRHRTEAERRVGALKRESSDPMIEAGGPSTGGLCKLARVCPPHQGVIMVAPPEVSRNA